MEERGGLGKGRRQREDCESLAYLDTLGQILVKLYRVKLGAYRLLRKSKCSHILKCS